MTDEQGLAPFEEAAAEALAELDTAESSETPESASPAPEEHDQSEDGQATPEASEQPESEATEEPEAEEEELFPLEEDEENGSDSFEIALDTELELPGVEGPITLQQLVDGNLRQADYTQKTQALAEQRREVEAVKESHDKAIAFWEALRKNPQEVVRQLAVEAKLVDADAKFERMENSPITSPEEMEAEISRRVEERLKEHPTVQEAADLRARQWIDGTFAQIEQTHDVKLGPQSRQAVLKEAARLGTDDLEFVFSGLQARRAERKQSADSLRNAAPSRPSGNSSKTADLPPVEDVEDAYMRSIAELGMT